MIIGNFDNDQADEILGIHTWATKFDFFKGQLQWSWSTGNTAMFSDWAVNRYSNCFFMKALKKGPDYFCSIEKLGQDYHANLFSMSNLIQGATSIVKSANDFENIKTNNPSNISNYLVSIYPNPNNGSFKIVINSQVSAMMFMDIYNELGIRIYQSNNTYK